MAEPATPGKRPFTERWWWFFFITGSFWIRLPLLVSDLIGGHAIRGLDVFAAVMLAVAVPLFLWVRRREARKRSVAASSTGGLQDTAQAGTVPG